MYDNGYIVKCRSILTNDICLSEASHKADVFLVCISYLTYSLKKCIDNLDKVLKRNDIDKVDWKVINADYLK